MKRRPDACYYEGGADPEAVIEWSCDKRHNAVEAGLNSAGAGPSARIAQLSYRTGE